MCNPEMLRGHVGIEGVEGIEDPKRIWPRESNMQSTYGLTETVETSMGPAGVCTGPLCTYYSC